MTLPQKVLAFLCGVAVLQMGALFFLFSQEDQQPTLPQVAAFDPEKSLTMFVVWSSEKMAEGDFASAIPTFQAVVQNEIDIYSATTGALVVRKDALLTSSAFEIPDATSVIMERVLNDEHF